MDHRHFLEDVDDQRVLQAIQAAESRTTGQLRVFISHHDVKDALAAAKKQFRILKMTKTTARNAILIFIAPKSRAFSVFGDVGIDQKCGAEFWQTLRDQITAHLKDGRYTEALIHAVTLAGAKLAEYFPATTPPANELPDQIAHD